MSTKLEAFVARVKETKEKIRAEAESLLADLLKEWFEANPDVEAIRIRGYVPYFNDGEPCTFGLHEAYFRLVGTDEDDESGDYDDGYISHYDDKATKAMGEIYDMLQELEDELNYQFGDHFVLNITRDGIECDDYEDHD